MFVFFQMNVLASRSLTYRNLMLQAADKNTLFNMKYLESIGQYFHNVFLDYWVNNKQVMEFPLGLFSCLISPSVKNIIVCRFIAMIMAFSQQ